MYVLPWYLAPSLTSKVLRRNMTFLKYVGHPWTLFCPLKAKCDILRTRKWDKTIGILAFQSTRLLHRLFYSCFHEVTLTKSDLTSRQC
jgi:hypothetical protein